MMGELNTKSQKIIFTIQCIIFGGFLVTQRMLAMYKKKKKDK